ncbi:hypothetical protein R3P38DRAFT_2800024 [Favolaschia claudopus]|uniref:Uncharacterized protein n=1 Tax=Favolaschia claudopus TaxID=2862362 RepID=A0AAW0A055_9AGAR
MFPSLLPEALAVGSIVMRVGSAASWKWEGTRIEIRAPELWALAPSAVAPPLVEIPLNRRTWWSKLSKIVLCNDDKRNVRYQPWGQSMIENEVGAGCEGYRCAMRGKKRLTSPNVVESRGARSYSPRIFSHQVLKGVARYRGGTRKALKKDSQSYRLPH